MAAEQGIHGLMAEFVSANELLKAVKAARKAGYRRMDAYSPFPIEEVCEELDSVSYTHLTLPTICSV